MSLHIYPENAHDRTSSGIPENSLQFNPENAHDRTFYGSPEKSLHFFPKNYKFISVLNCQFAIVSKLPTPAEKNDMRTIIPMP